MRTNGTHLCTHSTDIYTHTHKYNTYIHDSIQASSFYIPVRSGSSFLTTRQSSATAMQSFMPTKSAPSLIGYPRSSIRARFCVIRALHELTQSALPLIDLRRCVLCVDLIL